MPDAALGPASSGASAEHAQSRSRGQGDASLAAAARKQLLRSDDDVDGKPGREALILYSDRTIVAGNAMGTADLTEAGEFWMKERAQLRVVGLAPGLWALLLVLPSLDEEDPPSRFQLFRPAGERLERVLDLSPGFASAARLHFPGDGTVRYVEAPHEACARVGPGARSAKPREVIYALIDGAMVERPSKDGTRSVACSPAAQFACPFVYVGSAPAARAGEILRNVRSAAEARLAGLTLDAAPARSLRVVLAEEKREITFLDEIFVRIDAQIIRPRACLQTRSPSYCASGHGSWRLARGEALELEFALPESAGSPVLFARGYYTTLNSAR